MNWEYQESFSEEMNFKMKPKWGNRGCDVHYKAVQQAQRQKQTLCAQRIKEKPGQLAYGKSESEPWTKVVSNKAEVLLGQGRHMGSVVHAVRCYWRVMKIRRNRDKSRGREAGGGNRSSPEERRYWFRLGLVTVAMVRSGSIMISLRSKAKIEFKGKGNVS